jgi:hypothetical protein
MPRKGSSPCRGGRSSAVPLQQITPTPIPMLDSARVEAHQATASVRSRRPDRKPSSTRIADISVRRKTHTNCSVD